MMAKAHAGTGLLLLQLTGCSSPVNMLMSPGRAGSGKPVLALDFDGVICDSVGESSASAWVVSPPCLLAHASMIRRYTTSACAYACTRKAACSLAVTQAAAQASAKVWPELFAEQRVDQQKERVMQQMEIVRPVVETG